MNNSLLFILLLGIHMPYVICSSGAEVWEFGFDLPGSIQTFQDNGFIHFWEKSKSISIPSQPCLIRVYERIEVNNPVSKPEVSHIDNVATIQYGQWQPSESWYSVTAKSMPVPWICDPKMPPVPDFYV